MKRQKTSKHFRFLLLFFAALFWAGAVSAQIRVQGYVQDVSGARIIGATILEQGTTNGTITDLDGNFLLSVPENAKLQISYIGYQTQVVSVASNLVITLM